MQKSGDIGIGNTILDPKPRLVSLRHERKEQKIRDELNGEIQKQQASKVTLPKFSWDK
jgi:hypothetical protein